MIYICIVWIPKPCKMKIFWVRLIIMLMFSFINIINLGPCSLWYCFTMDNNGYQHSRTLRGYLSAVGQFYRPPPPILKKLHGFISRLQNDRTKTNHIKTTCIFFPDMLYVGSQIQFLCTYLISPYGFEDLVAVHGFWVIILATYSLSSYCSMGTWYQMAVKCISLICQGKGIYCIVYSKVISSK